MLQDVTATAACRCCGAVFLRLLLLSVPDPLYVMPAHVWPTQVMQLLSESHCSTFGNPEPTEVSLVPRPGKCILVSGHDMHGEAATYALMCCQYLQLSKCCSGVVRDLLSIVKMVCSCPIARCSPAQNIIFLLPLVNAHPSFVGAHNHHQCNPFAPSLQTCTSC